MYLPASKGDLLVAEFASRFVVADKNIGYKLNSIRYQFILALGVVGYRR